MILSVSESASVPEIWDLSVGRTDTVSVRYAYWHCVSVSVHYKQLTLFFNFLRYYLLNFAQNFRECLFNLAGSESGEKSNPTQLFAYISQLFVYKTRLWT